MGRAARIRVNAVAPGLIPTEMSGEYPAHIHDLVSARTVSEAPGTPGNWLRRGIPAV